jgi:hypothetical protein
MRAVEEYCTIKGTNENDAWDRWQEDETMLWGRVSWC